MVSQSYQEKISCLNTVPLAKCYPVIILFTEMISVKNLKSVAEVLPPTTRPRCFLANMVARKSVRIPIRQSANRTRGALLLHQIALMSKLNKQLPNTPLTRWLKKLRKLLKSVVPWQSEVLAVCSEFLTIIETDKLIFKN